MSSAELPPEIPDAEAIEPRRGLTTETVIFTLMGIAFVLAGVIYAIFDPYGDVGGVSGEVLFVAGGAFSFITAGYFWVALRTVQADVETSEREREVAGPEAADDPDAGGLYLPETSIWPLCIGVGTALTLVGIPLKWWFLLPGIALLGYGVVGFAHQSRTRG
jgi:Cytochrome c oxidase subunit IV